MWTSERGSKLNGMPILATDGRGIDLYTGSVSKMQTAVRHAIKSATEIRWREILSF